MQKKQRRKIWKVRIFRLLRPPEKSKLTFQGTFRRSWARYVPQMQTLDTVDFNSSHALKSKADFVVKCWLLFCSNDNWWQLMTVDDLRKFNWLAMTRCFESLVSGSPWVAVDPSALPEPPWHEPGFHKQMLRCSVWPYRTRQKVSSFSPKHTIESINWIHSIHSPTTAIIYKNSFASSQIEPRTNSFGSDKTRHWKYSKYTGICSNRSKIRSSMIFTESSKLVKTKHTQIITSISPGTLSRSSQEVNFEVTARDLGCGMFLSR